MYQRGQSDSWNPQPLPGLYDPPPDKGVVFPGKPYRQNLAMQRSIMEIFDEFTEIISGELRSSNLKDFEPQRSEKS